MKSWIYFIVFFFLSITTKAQEDSLLCLNNICFDPQPVQETVVLKDSILLQQETNENFETMISIMDPVGESEELEEYRFNNSKFFEPLVEDRPLAQHRFMDVPSRDMIWATHPHYESTRPNIRYLFNRPPCPRLSFFSN